MPLSILFVMRHSGFVRNFEAALDELARRGHRIEIVFELPRDQAEVADALAARYETVTWDAAPSRPSRWTAVAYALRRSIDGLRYRSAVYDAAPKLRRRGMKGLPGWLRALTALPPLRREPVLRVLTTALRRLDEALPVPRSVDAELAGRAPDRALVTPLVDGPTQSDWVRGARRRGIPTALAVTSWDNLTNKGRIHDDLDAVLVWNDAQVREAVELHGVPAARVRATGAHSYDHWFEWSPREDKRAFCERVGLPSDRPLVLYLCSSPFIAPAEPEFVLRWLRSLRETAPATLRHAGVLVRPHPANGAVWGGTSLAGLEPAVIWPARGADPRNPAAKADYYDTLVHCDAAVGVNTSAIVELAIAGRPAFTVLDDDFRETQEGTLHFAYLTHEGGGALRVADSLPAHYEQLAAALDGTGPARTGFVRDFVRPYGLDVPAAPCFADEVEKLTPTAPVHHPGPADLALRALLAPVAAALPAPGGKDRRFGRWRRRRWRRRMAKRTRQGIRRARRRVGALRERVRA
jgi:hypothetical protein